MSDDFFSNVPARRSARSSSTPTDAHDDFAQAISLRFDSADLRTARLLPGDLPPHHHRHPSTHTPAPPHSLTPPRPPPPQSFSSVPPSALAPYLADPRSLVLDIRPHAAHAAARINLALSLSVPTTLLKRPLFSLSKLSQMLPSPSSRARFADWSSASCILVYDSDSMTSPDNSIIAGLLRKFRAEGFIGELGWIRGGFQAVWRESRDLTTTEQPIQEEDDSDATSPSGALRTTHLSKAAFSLFSTTVVPLPQFGAIPPSHPLPNTPALSASRPANPFFDAIRQNVELSHGVTERIPLRLPRRVRRRIHDLPFRWLQDLARRSALRHSSSSRHSGLDSFESGSESSDDPHTSDPDENDPSVEEGTEALAMQFYRIELAEQRRLRSIMEHHTRESEVSGFTSSARPRRLLDKGGERGSTARTGSKSVPGTPHPTPFPFSITAAVEKGTKNRYTHIWPFEHARVRLHDGRHHGSHPSRREKGRSLERGWSARDRPGGEGREWEEQGLEEKQHQSRLSPAFGKRQDQESAGRFSPSRYSFYFEAHSSPVGASAGLEAGLSHSVWGSSPSVPRVKIEYDVTDQDTGMSGSPTPATALPFQTPPFYTPMEIPSAHTWPPHLLSLPSDVVSPGGRLGGTQFTPPASTLPSPGSILSPPLRLPKRPGGLLPSIGEQTWSLESLSPSAIHSGLFASRAGTVGESTNEAGIRRNLRREPSPVDDYVNASYVQPLGTRKRYIATQGPLPSTYVDFWTLVWEQNAHVIVMLTREVENAMVKCGSYWTDTEYGPLRLELLSISPPMSPSANLPTTDISKQGFFAIREPQGKTSGSSRNQPTLITRTFLLSHTSYPAIPPRRITHLQYLDWSDMNVPDDPRGVLDLIKRVEQAAAESTPGPSPSGSLSPASGSGSLPGSPSPDIVTDSKGYDTSLLSPTSAGTMPWGGRRRHGNEWRHPELDSRTGIAAFALGKAAPVLLHCSAGVGRTGGFIAVDAVLDGIRRELRKKTEERRLRKVSTVMNTDGKASMNDPGASTDSSVGSTEAGLNSIGSGREESVFDENERMDVDEPAIGAPGKNQDTPFRINAVPIHVSAGEPTKGIGRPDHDKNSSGGKQPSSSGSLVVHVPCAGSDIPKGTKVAGIGLGDSKEAGWQPHSTREWVEQVSDQTHAHTGVGGLSPPPSVHHSSRAMSPGSTSNNSSPSALNSADGSMTGSIGANADGSVSGSGDPPPSSVSKSGSGSISLSNSGSGTAGSQFGSSLLRAPLRDSSVTSISAESTRSLSSEHESKKNIPLDKPLVIHTRSSSDMDIDHPPRPVSVPLQTTHSNSASLQRTVHSRHRKPTFGSSPVGSISSPVLPIGSVQRDVSFGLGNSAKASASRSSPVLCSDELAGPPQELESRERFDADRSGQRSQAVFDESEKPAISTRPGSHLRLNTELSFLKVPEMLHSGSSTMRPPPARGTKGKERATVSPVLRIPDDSALHQPPTITGALGASECDQRAADQPVIDYKLPRELHSDLSPPLISSFAEPICMVIQDMREQRMSLCQSLRQYVFVHAAIIEGALRIVDEEHELWECGWTSDEASSAEGESGANVRKGGQRSSHGEGFKARLGKTDKVEAAVTTLDFEHGSISHKTLPLKTMPQSSNQWSAGSDIGGVQVQMTPGSSSSGGPSPSKGKRGPSPTELLREDRTGALSSNKRPSIHRRTRSDEGDSFSFESSGPSPEAGENGGGSRDTSVCASGIWAAPGRPVVPEKGGPTTGLA